MLWLTLSFLSATLLGLYDTCKKRALKGNSIFVLLFVNTLLCSFIFIPFIILSYNTDVLDGSIFHVARGGWGVHKFIILKSLIVLASWIFGYAGMKNLPLSITGPINATRPVLVLIGAIFVFGERLNLYQWIGVMLAITSFYMLSRSGKREGIDFKHDKWIFFVVLQSIFGAISGLYDRYLMAPVSEGGAGLDRMIVQSWYNIYQCLLMAVVLIIIFRKSVFRQFCFRQGWKYSVAVVCVSVFLSAADFAYFYALTFPDAMISIVSMIRRGSVIVSFTCAALFFHEKNLRSKALDLLLVLLSMFFLFLGSQ
ncbi:MAG: DMT family transporter [Prevotellaceae bacterium]|nr:DMT family transporter [Prevotellaceae bacterium]